VKTCLCRRCRATISIGHPERQLRDQARALAREAGLLARITGRIRVRKLEGKLIHGYYEGDPARQRTLPARCPLCHYNSDDDLPWWEPGLSSA